MWGVFGNTCQEERSTWRTRPKQSGLVAIWQKSGQGFRARRRGPFWVSGCSLTASIAPFRAGTLPPIAAHGPCATVPGQRPACDGPCIDERGPGCAASGPCIAAHGPRASVRVALFSARDARPIAHGPRYVKWRRVIHGPRPTAHGPRPTGPET
jgi:hypothetical protein